MDELCYCVVVMWVQVEVIDDFDTSTYMMTDDVYGIGKLPLKLLSVKMCGVGDDRPLSIRVCWATDRVTSTGRFRMFQESQSKSHFQLCGIGFVWRVVLHFDDDIDDHITLKINLALEGIQ